MPCQNPESRLGFRCPEPWPLQPRTAGEPHGISEEFLGGCALLRSGAGKGGKELGSLRSEAEACGVEDLRAMKRSWKPPRSWQFVGGR